MGFILVGISKPGNSAVQQLEQRVATIQAVVEMKSKDHDIGQRAKSGKTTEDDVVWMAELYGRICTADLELADIYAKAAAGYKATGDGGYKDVVAHIESAREGNQALFSALSDEIRKYTDLNGEDPFEEAPCGMADGEAAAQAANDNVEEAPAEKGALTEEDELEARFNALHVRFKALDKEVFEQLEQRNFMGRLMNRQFTRDNYADLAECYGVLCQKLSLLAFIESDLDQLSVEFEDPNLNELRNHVEALRNILERMTGDAELRMNELNGVLTEDDEDEDDDEADCDCDECDCCGCEDYGCGIVEDVEGKIDEYKDKERNLVKMLERHRFVQRLSDGKLLPENYDEVVSLLTAMQRCYWLNLKAQLDIYCLLDDYGSDVSKEELDAVLVLLDRHKISGCVMKAFVEKAEGWLSEIADICPPSTLGPADAFGEGSRLMDALHKQMEAHDYYAAIKGDNNPWYYAGYYEAILPVYTYAVRTSRLLEKLYKGAEASDAKLYTDKERFCMTRLDDFCLEACAICKKAESWLDTCVATALQKLSELSDYCSNREEAGHDECDDCHRDCDDCDCCGCEGDEAKDDAAFLEKHNAIVEAYNKTEDAVAKRLERHQLLERLQDGELTYANFDEVVSLLTHVERCYYLNLKAMFDLTRLRYEFGGGDLSSNVNAACIGNQNTLEENRLLMSRDVILKIQWRLDALLANPDIPEGCDVHELCSRASAIMEMLTAQKERYHYDARIQDAVFCPGFYAGMVSLCTYAMRTVWQLRKLASIAEKVTTGQAELSDKAWLCGLVDEAVAVYDNVDAWLYKCADTEALDRAEAEAKAEVGTKTEAEVQAESTEGTGKSEGGSVMPETIDVVWSAHYVQERLNALANRFTKQEHKAGLLFGEGELDERLKRKNYADKKARRQMEADLRALEEAQAVKDVIYEEAKELTDRLDVENTDPKTYKGLLEDVSGLLAMVIESRDEDRNTINAIKKWLVSTNSKPRK